MKNNVDSMIHLTISAEKPIATIQKEFNDAFPYLKLEFFKHRHGVHAANPKSDLIQGNFALKDLKSKPNKAVIQITEDMPVSELEHLFQKLFGVSAQVFRKSGRSWLETSVTDDWTLKRQNDEGLDLSGFTR